MHKVSKPEELLIDNGGWVRNARKQCGFLHLGVNLRSDSSNVSLQTFAWIFKERKYV